jgi:hypothetical protein
MHDIDGCRLGLLEGDHWLCIHGSLAGLNGAAHLAHYRK